MRKTKISGLQARRNKWAPSSPYVDHLAVFTGAHLIYARLAVVRFATEARDGTGLEEVMSIAYVQDVSK